MSSGSRHAISESDERAGNSNVPATVSGKMLGILKEAGWLLES